MKRKIKQKGFIQIPLLIGIIISLVTVSALTTGVIFYKQGRLSPLVANVSEVFKDTEQVESEIESEESQSEERSLLEEINQTGDFQAEQEAQRIAEEEQEQKELERKEAEEARIAAEKEARQEAEEERQQQQEYSYYIQKLNTIKSNLLNKKPSITLVLGQIDALYEQDMNKVISDYEDKLAQAQKSYQSELNEMAEYYASRGLTFSSARTTAEAELLANYNSYIKGLENEYLQYLANTDTYYVKKEEDLKDSLNNIDSKIKDIDYLVSKLQQQILSEVDKILLNKALTY